MAERALTKMQFGIETTRGTAVAANTMLMGEHQPISPDITNEIVEEDIGVRAKGARVRKGDVKGVTDVLRLPNLYFQALPALLSCGLKGSITPTEQTPSQSDYLWSFVPNMTSANAPQAMTLELGDDSNVVEREFLMFEGYRLQVDIPQQRGAAPVLFEGQYFARQNTDASFTGGLSLPAAENVNAKLVRYYRDTAWSGVGGTEKTGVLRRADVQLMTGVHPKWMGGANRYFDTYGEGELHFIAAFTFEGGTEAEAVRDLMDSGALSVVRLQVEGSQIGTGVNHKLTLDLGGFWRDVIPLAENDRGNNIHTAVLEGRYDTTGAKILQASVITNVSAI